MTSLYTRIANWIQLSHTTIMNGLILLRLHVEMTPNALGYSMKTVIKMINSCQLKEGMFLLEGWIFMTLAVAFTNRNDMPVIEYFTVRHHLKTYYNIHYIKL